MNLIIITPMGIENMKKRLGKTHFCFQESPVCVIPDVLQLKYQKIQSNIVYERKIGPVANWQDRGIHFYTFGFFM